MIKIDDDVPLPLPKGGRPPLKGSLLATLRALNPGQSAWFAGRTSHDTSAWMSSIRRERPERVFLSRKEGEGVRVWRVRDAYKTKVRPSDLFR